MNLEIEQLAKLARLHLNEDEKKRLQQDLEHVLKHVDQLLQVDVSGVTALSHPIDIAYVGRSDEPRELMGQEGLKQSSGYENGLVRVPKVIE